MGIRIQSSTEILHSANKRGKQGGTEQQRNSLADETAGRYHSAPWPSREMEINISAIDLFRHRHFHVFILGTVAGQEAIFALNSLNLSRFLLKSRQLFVQWSTPKDNFLKYELPANGNPNFFCNQPPLIQKEVKCSFFSQSFFRRIVSCHPIR